MTVNIDSRLFTWEMVSSGIHVHPFVYELLLFDVYCYPHTSIADRPVARFSDEALPY